MTLLDPTDTSFLDVTQPRAHRCESGTAFIQTQDLASDLALGTSNGCSCC